MMTCTRRKVQRLFQIMVLLLIFGSFFYKSFAFAEVIDGPANLRDKPSGKIIAVLNDRVDVEMYPPYILDKVWYSIVFVGYVEKGSCIDSGEEVKANCNLFNKRGQPIGKTLDNIKADWTLNEENGRVGAVIDRIYTHINNIKANSIPESELVGLLDSKESTIQKSELEEFLLKYGFEKWTVLKDKELDDYFIYESGLYDPSPMPRLQLIFFNNALVSVIHRDLLHSKKHQSRDLFRHMKRMDVTKINADVSKRIQKGIIEPLKTAD